MSENITNVLQVALTLHGFTLKFESWKQNIFPHSKRKKEVWRNYSLEKNDNIKQNRKRLLLRQVSTTCEASINLNWPFLLFENYGMYDKKQWIVTFGICYQIFCVLAEILLFTLVIRFGIVDIMIKDYKEGVNLLPGLLPFAKLLFGSLDL